MAASTPAHDERRRRGPASESQLFEHPHSVGLAAFEINLLLQALPTVTTLMRRRHVPPFR
jgi:hypothetical protein